MVFDIPALAGTALRLGVALLLGSAIGFARQWNRRMAGLRTNALVALGAAGFVAFSGLVRRVDARLPVATDGETHYTVEIVCRGAEKARMRSLLLHGRLGLGPDVTAATGRSAARCPSPEREFWTPFLDRSAILDSRCPEMVGNLNDSNGPISGHLFLDSAGVQKCRSGPAVQAIAPAARSAAISRSP